MHFHLEVLLPGDLPREEVEAHLEKVLEPYRESYDEVADELVGHWDFWQVGGRWRGEHAQKGGTPDPRTEPCFLCNGTGTRSDAVGIANGMVERGWCNGCDGNGKRQLWPTQWDQHPDDIARNGDVRTDLTAYAVIDLDGVWTTLGELSHDPEAYGPRVPRPETDCWLVTVDYHQ